jgi:hypothetical protein
MERIKSEQFFYLKISFDVQVKNEKVHSKGQFIQIPPPNKTQLAFSLSLFDETKLR